MGSPLRSVLEEEYVNDDGGESVASGSTNMTTGMDGGGGGLTREEQEEIAKRENRAVFWLRVFVFVVLVGSMVAVGIVVHNYLSESESDDFQMQYKSDATKILEGIGKSFDTTLGNADAFSLTLVSYARTSNSTWPFVTYPDFGVQVLKLLKGSKAFWMSIFLFVQEDQLGEWLQYAKENGRGWVDATLEAQEKDPDFKGVQVDNYTTADNFLYGFQGPVTEPDPVYGNGNYLVSWQEGPTVPNPFPYNFEGFSNAILAPDVAYATKVKRVLLGSRFQNVIFNPDDPVEIAASELTNAFAAQFLGPDEKSEEPTTAIGYPIIDITDSVRVDVDQELPPLVAFFNFQVYWRDLIKDILPENSQGMILVVESECVQQFFTYRIDGPVPTFLGVGDLHNPKYDEMEIRETLPNLMSTSNERESSYTGIPLDDYCQKIFHVYPSEDMESQYITNNPAIFAAVAVGIFAFTSLVFLAYDMLVSYRQKVVMRRAKASDAIVTSLFPKDVRQQLYDENAKKEEDAKNVKNFLNNGSAAQSSRPIANEFHETTVFFADIAGFTAWSAKRTPAGVFELLENIYGRFDRIAKRRGVFKVETIGDCYVAVTGIPEPMSDHAVVMMKFAKDCMTEMTKITHDMMETLGPDTGDLRMRIGCHSGSITAGVLRGEKGRFQLFGDTVNTASRMESHGIPDHIHISQDTADALILKGKSHWLTPREDKISPKGKDLMQTYFCSLKSGQSIATMSVTGSALQSAPESTTSQSDDTEEVDGGDEQPSKTSSC